MRVLVACEYSGIVRDAFARRGHLAVSCDLLPSERPQGYHKQGDVRLILDKGWDLLIAHPDCTYLTSSAEWAYSDGPYHQQVKIDTPVGAKRRELREQALDFVRLLLSAPIRMKCIENPARGAINTKIRRPDQIIQPNQFGHDASKATGLWLENLPQLTPTKVIAPRWVCSKCGKAHDAGCLYAKYCWRCGASVKYQLPRWGNQTNSGQNKLSPSESRWKDRARTYQGWADAMADQWG